MGETKNGATAKYPAHLHSFLDGKSKVFRLISMVDLAEHGDITGEDNAAVLLQDQETSTYVEGTITFDVDAKDACQEAVDGDGESDNILVECTPVDGTHIPLMRLVK